MNEMTEVCQGAGRQQGFPVSNWQLLFNGVLHSRGRYPSLRGLEGREGDARPERERERETHTHTHRKAKGGDTDQNLFC